MAEELSPFFRGYAKIELKYFEFQFSNFGRRILNPSHFKLLQDKFETDGCAREEPRNFITAVVDDDLLSQAIYQYKETPDIIKDETILPRLDFPRGTRLICLYGKHRVEAAKRALLPGDRWWSVALYSDGLPDHLRRRICMYRDPEFAPGDIFRNWRHCELNGHADASFWQSMVSARSRKDIKRLNEDYKGIMRSIDRLIIFPGLWADFCFTFIRRILQIGCPNETIHYLDRIYQIWSNLCKSFPEVVDVQSTRSIENLMPQQSRMDCSQIVQLMDDGILFPLIEKAPARALVAGTLSKISGRILTLHSMIQDTLLWHPCSATLKQLVPGKFKDLRHALMLQFHPGGGETDWPVQVAEGIMEYRNYGTCEGPGLQSQRLNSAWVQLWCFTIRHIENLTNTKLAGRKTSTTEPQAFRPTQRESNHQLGLLAVRLSFESGPIKSLRGDTALRSNVKAYLLGRRPTDIYRFSTDWEEKASGSIIDHLTEPEQKSDYEPRIPLFTEHTSQHLKRCGLPFFKSHERDRRLLFLPYLYSPEQPMGEFPSSFAIIRDMIFCFLGENMFPEEDPREWNSSPVALEAHPPGTPITEWGNSLFTQEATDFPLQSNNVPGSDEDLSNQQLHEALATSQKHIDTNYKAAGFENDNNIAPLNEMTSIAHHRGGVAILNAWVDSKNTSLAVFYFFKTRQYIKFSLMSNNLDSTLRNVLNSVANSHLFSDTAENCFSTDYVVKNIQNTNLICIYTERESLNVSEDFIEYISLFDPHTGKRDHQGDQVNEEEQDRERKRGGERSREIGAVMREGDTESEY